MKLLKYFSVFLSLQTLAPASLTPSSSLALHLLLLQPVDFMKIGGLSLKCWQKETCGI